VNRTDDLVASAKSVHERYRAGRMARETVREWVGRLGLYPDPHGSMVKAAAEWFRVNKNDDIGDDVKQQDLAVLSGIFNP